MHFDAKSEWSSWTCGRVQCQKKDSEKHQKRERKSVGKESENQLEKEGRTRCLSVVRCNDPDVLGRYSLFKQHLHLKHLSFEREEAQSKKNKKKSDQCDHCCSVPGVCLTTSLRRPM